jgi:hypothetical protein
MFKGRFSFHNRYEQNDGGNRVILPDDVKTALPTQIYNINGSAALIGFHCPSYNVRKVDAS